MLRRRTALVTGAARGIGRAVAEKLAESGFSVAVNYNTSEREALQLVEKLQSRGINSIAVQADVSDYREVMRLYAQCHAYFGFIDTLVNNAGICSSKILCDCTPADYERTLNINLRSVFNTCRLFSPDMVSEGFGRIVNIASVWGERGASAETLYSTSKAGIIGFTKALNAELAPSNVIVNCVSPGFIDTAMNASLSPGEVEEFLSGVSLGRAGTAEEVADAVELLTREKLYIAGADIPVNGGML